MSKPKIKFCVGYQVRGSSRREGEMVLLRALDPPDCQSRSLHNLDLHSKAHAALPSIESDHVVEEARKINVVEDLIAHGPLEQVYRGRFRGRQSTRPLA